jgi:hypothetical protein
MADQKVYDLVVTTGQYVDKQGNQKREYETIGTVFQGQKGMYAIMKKTFNPAGVPSDRSSFFVNFYEPRDRNAQATRVNGNVAPKDEQFFDDDMPF